MVSDTFSGAHWRTVSLAVKGRNISFSGDMDAGPAYTQRLSYNLTLSDDGEKLAGTLSDYFYNGGYNNNYQCVGKRLR
jgi:hypothetical protein